MTDTTESLIKALRILANDIQSDDGVANCVVNQAADRLEELTKQNEHFGYNISRLEQDNHEMHARWRGSIDQTVRIKQLEQENDALRADLMLWAEAKEDKV